MAGALIRSGSSVRYPVWRRICRITARQGPMEQNLHTSASASSHLGSMAEASNAMQTAQWKAVMEDAATFMDFEQVCAVWVAEHRVL
jgi:hypothetical protein